MFVFSPLRRCLCDHYRIYPVPKDGSWKPSSFKSREIPKLRLFVSICILIASVWTVLSIFLSLHLFQSPKPYGNHDIGIPQTLLVDDVHKLMYCYIPKNSCTKFKQLWWAMITNGTRLGRGITSGGIHSVKDYRRDNTFLWETMYKKPRDHSWKLMVVIRDPAERLVPYISSVVPQGFFSGLVAVVAYSHRYIDDELINNLFVGCYVCIDSYYPRLPKKSCIFIF